jgi:CelD/BcsL family acetyltransferase involved in cellulose biosynthesis
VPGFTEAVTTSGSFGLAGKRLAFDLTLNGNSIAQQIGFVHGGRYYAYISGMDWNFQDLGPGRIHLAKVIEEIHNRGLARAELLTPASDYKMVWTDDRHHLADMAIALSSAGRIKQTMWDRGLRPLIKSAYYATPASVRRMLAGRTHGANVENTAVINRPTEPASE